MAALTFAVPVEPLAAVAAARWAAAGPPRPWSRRPSAPADGRRCRAGRLAAARPARARSCSGSSASCSSSARSTPRATWPCAPTGPTASSAPTCSSSLAMMTLVTLSHHLGLMWVAMEATTLVSAPSIYFNHNAALAGGDLEVPADRLGGHRPGPARARSSSPTRRCKAGLESTLLFDQLIAGRRPAVAAVAARGLRAAVRRLRHQDGPGPDAHLEARRLRRGAGRSWARSWPAASPAAPSWRSCASTRSAAPAGEAEFARELMIFMGLLSMAVAAVFMVRQRDFKRMLAYSSVEHMGILVLGIGIGGAGRLRGPAAPDQQRPDQGRAVPVGRQHPPGLRQQDHRRRARGAAARARSRARCSWPGFLAITGSPAVRPVRQRVHHRAARPSAAGSSSSAAAVPAAAGGRVHRHGGHRAGRGAGRAAPEPAPPRAAPTTTASAPVAPGRAAGAGAAAGLTSRRRCERCCARPPRFLEVQPMTTERRSQRRANRCRPSATRRRCPAMRAPLRARLPAGRRGCAWPAASGSSALFGSPTAGPADRGPVRCARRRRRRLAAAGPDGDARATRSPR